VSEVDTKQTPQLQQTWHDGSHCFWGLIMD
jgi:hypothetical protein